MKRDCAELAPGEISASVSSIFAGLTLARTPKTWLLLHFQLVDPPELSNFSRAPARVESRRPSSCVASGWERVWL